MRAIRQAITVTLVSLYTIPQRLNSAAVAIVGIMGVVVVFIAVLSIGEGFKAAMTNAGKTDRAIVMRSGADSEMSSGLAGADVDIIKQMPGIRHEGVVSTASAEMFVVLNVNRRSTDTPANVPLRGVDTTALAVRYDARVTRGRMFTFGTNEVVVGRQANGQFAGLNVGDTLSTGKAAWQVVGMFETGGTVAETEIWCDVRVLQGVYQRGNSYQSVLVHLDSPAAFDAFKDKATSDPRLDVQVKRESDYYAEQSVGVTNLIQGVGYVVAALMGIGAIFGAWLTMYSAVVTRTREIATLRALGFGSGAVLISVIGESVFLALIGGAIGASLAYVGFNGYQASTMNWQTFSQVAFEFAVTPRLLTTGLIYALVMGLLASLFPAIRAARLPISKALREL
jgi:putative ABC transport system permease protein